jgi:hypothetical protein
MGTGQSTVPLSDELWMIKFSNIGPTLALGEEIRPELESAWFVTPMQL